MGGSSKLRTALLAGGALASALIGTSLANAQEAAGQVDFTDSHTAGADGAALDLSTRTDQNARFAQVSPPSADAPQQAPRRLELELAAGGRGSPVDVAIAQRASIGSNEDGDIDRSGRGSELRVGRGLVAQRENQGQGSSVYMFVASDNEALTWQPGARATGDALALQDRVEVGDHSAGVTYEQNGVQASLAYVERRERTRVGNRNFNQDQSFAGVTVTMRH